MFGALLKGYEELIVLSLASRARVFIYQEPVDMRKSFEGLGVLVEDHFADLINQGAYFAFFNRLRNKIKVLYWDMDGLAIWYKRLEKGVYTRSEGSILGRREFFMILEGITPQKIQKRYTGNISCS